EGSARTGRRISLRTRVRAGLNAYADRWKFNQSPASVNAVSRLTALINRLEILEGIVRYYLGLELNAPTGGLNLGSKLNDDSSLYTDLNTQYSAWQVG